MARLTLKVNGKNQTIDVEPDMPLLYALRNDLQLNGPKFGCGLSQCGACTVIIDTPMLWSFMTAACRVIYEKIRRTRRTHNDSRLDISPYEKIINLSGNPSPERS